MHGGGNLPRGQ